MARVGESAHYVSHGSPVREDGTQAYESKCRAAIITEVGEQTGFGILISLCVLNPTGCFFDQGVEEDKISRQGGTWHYPSTLCGTEDSSDTQ